MGPVVASSPAAVGSPTACRICTGATWRRYSLCTSCRDVAISLGRPLVPVTAITTVTASSSLYRALRQYKSATHHAAQRQAAALTATLAEFAARRTGRPLPASADATVVVPSGPGGRPPPHPLVAVAEAAGFGPTAPWLAACATPPTPVGHRHACSAAYVASSEVGGKRVLLLDDVYTSGAHLQSAAAALEIAGARVVQAVVVARFSRGTGECSAAPVHCGSSAARCRGQ